MTTIDQAPRPTTVDEARPGRLALARRTLVVSTVVVVAMAAGMAGAVAVALARGRPAGRRYFARRVARMVVRLGPTFIKAAQVLGTRRDVVPPYLCDELSVLQDAVPPLSPAEGREALRLAYGDLVDEIFSAVDPQPVASGSVASVYRAELADGSEVAVKLQRPGIAGRMRADLDLIRRGSRLVAKLPMFRGVPVEDVVGNLCDSVLGQLDFTREAANLDRLREELAVVPRVRVPRVHPGACRPTAIVMDFVPDLDLTASERCSPAARRAFAVATLNVVYQMLFINGFVHCDLHPGNLYFTERGQVIVLDAGFSVQLTEKMRLLFAEFFLNMSLGRGERCASIVIQSSLGIGPDADVASFTAGVADLVARSHRTSAKEFSLIAFAAELFDLQRNHGVAASPELVFPLLSLLVIEGTVRDLDPDVDFQEAAKPTLTRALFAAR
jgi:ubiquinone biosynthesis protein